MATQPRTSITALECTLLAATIPRAELARAYCINNADDDHAMLLVDFAAGDFAAAVTSLTHAPSSSEQSLVLAAAHICLFVQQNISGPIDPDAAAFAPDLSIDGEDAILVTGATHLTAAYDLLLPRITQPSTLPTTHWWALRCCVLRQRILAHPAATLAQHIDTCITTIQHTLPSAALYIEIALAHQLHGRVGDAAHCLSLAEQHSGFTVQVDGVMGMRTKHQQQPKAQLVVAEHDHSNGVGADDEGLVEAEVIDNGAVLDDEEHQGMHSAWHTIAQQQAHWQPQPHTDVLPLPILLPDPASSPPPKTSSRPVLHALLVTYAKQVERATAADDLQAYQMTPYIEAVLRQPSTTPACRYAARLLRARHERTRSRTRARSLLAYESLLSVLRTSLPSIPTTTRLLYALSTPLPLHTQLRKEAAEEMVACGLVGQALCEYQALEAWDALVACYRMLGKAQAAEQLVQERLQVQPTRASLWCTLGDLQLDDSLYQHALDVSDGRSVRALRSLARSAMNRKEFGNAATYWERALAINPLHEQGWFALGYCCLKDGNHTRALQAFTRAAQLDPENAEAWNNIAAVHMQHDNLQPAYAALSEALKRTRDNWRMWSNYATIAAATHHWPQALQAVERVMTLTGGEQLPMQVLHDAVGPSGPSPPPALLGKVLKQAAAGNHATGALWATYAAYFAQSEGNLQMARECLLKAVRALQGRTEERALLGEVTVRLANTTLQLVEQGDVGVRELSGVRLQVRGMLRGRGHEDDGRVGELRRVLERIEQRIAADG